MKKVLWILCGLLLLGFSGFWLFVARGNQGQLKFRFAEVTRGDLEVIVSSTGTLAAVGTVEVGAQVSADLKKIYVDFNDKVKKGQILAEFDTSLLKADLVKAQADLLRAQAALDKANADFKRNQPLYKKGFLSEAEFLAFKLDRQSAEAQLESAKAALDMARVNLRYAVIRSPVDGTVIERAVEEGQTLVSRMSTPKLFVIAEDLSKMEIQVSVDESDIGQIREGQEVRFTVQAYPDKPFHGRVRQIRLQPQIVQNVVNYTVIVDAENPSGNLLPGMTATVDFIVNERKNVLLVPNQAIQFKPPAGVSRMIENPPAGPGPGERPRHHGHQERARVLVETGPDRVRPVIFKPGISDGQLTEVVEGSDLQEGSRVAIGTDEGGAKEESHSFRFGPGRRRGRRGPPPF